MNFKDYLKVLLTDDGKYVVSGWTDGIVRFYTPQSGKRVHEVEKN